MNNELRDLLKIDYDKTLAFVDKMDDILFRIKNWAIVTSGAIIALAISINNRYALLVNLLLIYCFLVLELFYKCFHEDALIKSHLIEELLFSDPNNEQIQGKRQEYVFGLGHAINLPNARRMTWILFHRFHMSFLYLILLVLNILGFYFFDMINTIA